MTSNPTRSEHDQPTSSSSKLVPLAESQTVSTSAFSALTESDSKKKYTVILLVSIGATLLLTGRSGKTLIKRAKPTPKTSVNSTHAGSAEVQTAAGNDATPIPIGYTSNHLTSSQSAPRPVPKMAFPFPVSPPPLPIVSQAGHRSFLRQWRRTEPATSTLVAPGVTEEGTTDYFLPNEEILSRGTVFAQRMDAAEKLHDEGRLANTRESSKPSGSDNENVDPGLLALKAFLLATLINLTLFSAAIISLMKWYDVDDLEGLALGLSHSLPNVLEDHRPTLPTWSIPAIQEVNDAQIDSDFTSEEEKMYWYQVKEILDREAAEWKAERRKAWESRKSKQV